MHLKRRTNSKEERRKSDEIVRDFIAIEAEKKIIQEYERNKLYDHFRQNDLMIIK